MATFKISLPMYRAPNLTAALSDWMVCLRRHLRDVSDDDFEIVDGESDEDDLWKDPHLGLSQTCGYPFATGLIDLVALVATPCYRAPGCSGAFYRSAVVVAAHSRCQHLSDLRNTVVAVNGSCSYSGAIVWHGILGRNPAGFFSNVFLSGAHQDSMLAVAEGRADCAAVDCVSLGLIGDAYPELHAQLRVIAWSRPAPGLPYITAMEDSDLILAALDRAVRDPASEEARRVLRLKGFERISAERYRTLGKWPVWVE